ncbi:2-polyprenyl-6-methoxyphenol hydroxylase [Variovorax sp. PDC80]|uniref:FAD-dependent monooxygenase n=1 Tax=Variovorax sp. PDC80 TaxID=1882827 RepID=UPI0008EF9C94|nr:FAD-dependent monooxygenase [Variovorax sp. PDC80]SFN98955.1 2-polyprenyl-6-methoxyphenol hydroxylase [Variovorax sp. PDC80]
MIDNTQVLIVGGGPVGLAAAIELGSRGVKTTLVEAADRIGRAPRAKTTNVRTCEHLRRWGILDHLRAASPLGLEYPSDISFATRLTGIEIARIPNAANCSPARDNLYSAHAQWIPQYKLEAVLLEHAQNIPGVRIEFGARLTELSSHESEVISTIEHQGVLNAVSSQYVIGADGARSTVRGLIGANMTGKGGLSVNRMLIFRQKGLRKRTKLGPAIMYWLVNESIPAVLGPMDDDDVWYINGPESFMSRLPPVELIREATGCSDIEPEILAIEDWKAHELIANKYNQGRIFLAGDACHLHPPYGGYGMNLGVADAVDIGWKIAAVISGWAGSDILSSYEIERRAVHERVVEEAVLNHSVRTVDLVTPNLEDLSEKGRAAREACAKKIYEHKTREFKSLGIVLGSRYEKSPIISFEDPVLLSKEDSSTYIPSSRPGSLAPHAWLHHGQDYGSSLYDHFGHGYTLLSFVGASAETVELRDFAAKEKIPLSVVIVDDAKIAALYEKKYVLIRPDQYVAWRGDVIKEYLEIFGTLTGRRFLGGRGNELSGTSSLI